MSHNFWGKEFAIRGYLQRTYKLGLVVVACNSDDNRALWQRHCTKKAPSTAAGMEKQVT
jgi:hypothetical protein